MVFSRMASNNANKPIQLFEEVAENLSAFIHQNEKSLC